MKTVRTLIDLARAKVHTDRELADLLGVKPTVLSELRSGQRVLSPEAVAALCDVLQLPGEECQAWIAQSLIENPKNKDKLAMLRRALFACWALGVAALTSQPTDAQARTEEQGIPTIDTSRGYVPGTDCLHIVARHLRRSFNALRQARCFVAGLWPQAANLSNRQIAKTITSGF